VAGYGVTGDFGTTPSTTPAQNGDIALGGTAVEIAVGSDHICALLDTGAIRCWGAGYTGQLGYGNTDALGEMLETTPDKNGDVPWLSPEASSSGRVAVGYRHTCALTSLGAVRCWGEGGYLGYGHTLTVGDAPGNEPATAGDIPLGGTATQVVMGSTGEDFHVCALLESGGVRCWGFPDRGELGYGNQILLGGTPSTTPAMIGDVPLGGTATQLAAGDTHTCALLDSGTVRCWGDGMAGRLGYGNPNSLGATPSTTPAMNGDIPLGGIAVQIAAGGVHTCALLASGAVRCWGYGADGALGYGNSTSLGDSPVTTPNMNGDVPLGGIAVQLAAGGTHTCALLTTGAVRCWGQGGAGQLGYGNMDTLGNTPGTTPEQNGDVPLGGAAVEISAGQGYTCALLVTGGVRCWGTGSVGQLGYGDTVPRGGTPGTTPAAIGDVPLGGAAVSISAGLEHTCAMLAGDEVRCWGAGGGGRLGYGNEDDLGATPMTTPDQNGAVPWL